MLLKLPAHIEKFNFYVNQLQKYEGTIEIRKVLRPRTLKQNKYLHSLIALYAIETGFTLDEMKTILKRECSFMRYEKDGNIFLKRSRDFDTKELSEWIDWIRNYAGMNGFYLPNADEYMRNWEEIERTIESQKQYL